MSINPCVESRFVPVFVPAVKQLVSLKPAQDKHYDSGLCMTSHPKYARWMANTMREYGKSAAADVNESLEAITFIEASAGSGGMSRYFLEDGSTKKLLIYTPSQTHVTMGRNILKDFGFDTKRYSMSKNFTGVQGAGRGFKKQNMLFIDLLDNDEIMAQGQTTRYVNGLSAEQWINKSWNCSVIGVRTPKGYQIDDAQLPNFLRKEYADLGEDDGYFFLYVPNPANLPPRISTKSVSASVTPSPKVKSMGLDMSALKKVAAQQAGAKASPKKSVKTSVKIDYPAVVQPPVKTNDKFYVKIYGQTPNQEMVTCGLSDEPISYDVWLSALKDKVRETLLLFLPRADHVDRLLADDVIDIWAACFTHESIDDRSFKNYESMETLGDTTMKVNFQKYIMEMYPDVTPEQMTDMTNTYVSRDVQGDLGKKLEFHKYLRIASALKAGVSISEDILEAFFGGIVLGSEIAFGNMAIGQGLSYNFVKVLYGNMDISLKESLKNNKNYVKETLNKVGINYYEDRDERDPNRIIARIYVIQGSRKLEESYVKKNFKRLTKDAVKIFNDLGVGSVPTDRPIVLAEMTGPSAAMIKKSILNRLFGKAKNELNRLGLSFHEASRINFGVKIREGYLADMADRLMEKLAANGYVFGYFKDMKNTVGRMPIMLFKGIRPDGSNKTLVTAGGVDKNDATRRCVCNYIGVPC